MQVWIHIAFHLCKLWLTMANKTGVFIFNFGWFYGISLIVCYLMINPLHMGTEHSGKGIVSRRSHNAKLFERIEHSGSR